MYKIIGADGKEYGPVTAEQLKQWIADGRVNHQTKVLTEGAVEWRTLTEIPELAVVLPIKPSAGVAARPDTALAMARVKGPAIALIVTASFGIAYYLLNAVFTFFAGGAVFQHGIPSQVPPELRSVIEGMRGPVAGLVSLALVALNVFVLFGAIKLLRLQSYGLVMAAVIVAMLPCQCCCVFGLPFGIWALVVLSKPEVKQAFS